MKTIRFTRRASDALSRHGNRSANLLAKIEACAANPAAGRNNVKALQGSNTFRLRVGSFRIVFEETAAEIVVLDIGPRGGICE